MALHAVSLVTHRRLVDDIECHRPDAALIVLPPPCPLNITPIEFDGAGELIERALGDARKFLASGREHRDAIDMRLGSQTTESDVRVASQASLTRQ